MKKEECQRKIESLLDPEHYRKLKKDPTPKIERQTRVIIKESQIPVEEQRRLLPSERRPPRLYGLPKLQKYIDRVYRTQRTRVEQQPATYACLPYVAGVTDKLKKTLSKKNIGVRFRTVKKIQQVLPSNKDPVPRLLTKGVYELKCTCGKSYIGQTGRSIQCVQWIKEHQRHTRLRNTDKSAIAEHVHTYENHKIDYENIRVVDKTTRYYPRIIRESQEIMKNNNNFNREDGYRLSLTWRLAIPRTSDLECHGQPSSTDVQPNIAEPRYTRSRRRQDQSLETF
ncbi:hypothetical protein NQ318_014812 [Aromia moschata]|uniref:GIY-YIG homing endonuclease n=1 Tax=Aromia moschata TaxID=1265417 RepID=A0AAV8ZD33_9CUCU|nr:hypothetical protein NQ318_014812 [Aromia moschata]